MSLCDESEDMTQDEIIDLAEAAGMTRDGDMWFSNGQTDMDVHISHLEAFAKLVAAKEREACAKECDKKSVPQKGKLRNDAQWVAMNLAAEIRARAQAERGEA